MGYDVTVYEALHLAGGVLVYGIPEFRLPKAIVQKEVDNLKALGVKVETDMVIGRILTIEELKEEYGFEAIFIGTGAGLPRFMNIPGENLKGVYSANEFLTRSNLMKAYREDSTTPIQHAKRVAVVGGGNVAMDAARTAKRLGPRKCTSSTAAGWPSSPPVRRKWSMPRKRASSLRPSRTPSKSSPTGVSDPRDPNYGWVSGIRCVEMELGEPDESGRRRPVVKEGSEFELPMDCVIMALGTSPNPLLKKTTPGLETKRRGEIAADENGLTSIEGVYAGGDAVTGAATVILAMGAGKTAAAAMDAYIKGKKRVN